MKPNILALRAISSTFALGIIGTAGIWGGVIIGGLLLIIGALAYFFSVWWWAAAIPVVSIGLVGLVIWLVLRFILKNIQPAMSTDQHKATSQFVEKAQRLFDNATTPYPLLAGRIVIETALKRKDGLITEVIGDSKGLREEFIKVSSEFK